MNATREFPGIAELLPHKDPMILIDRVAAMEDEWLESELTLREDSPFCADGKVGHWVGIEYMAQTVAAFAGLEGRAGGGKPRLGFLLGTRKYECKVPFFEAGWTLRVRAEKEFIDPSGLSAVKCSIRRAGAAADDVLVEATVTVFQVENFEAFIKEQDS